MSCFPGHKMTPSSSLSSQATGVHRSTAYISLDWLLCELSIHLVCTSEQCVPWEVDQKKEVVCYTIYIHTALAFSLRLLYFRSKFLSYQNKIGWASLIQLDLKRVVVFRVRKTAENSKHFWPELFESKVRSKLVGPHLCN